MLTSIRAVREQGIDPEGIAAISRWLNVATPPEKGAFHFNTPKGLQKSGIESDVLFWHPYWGADRSFDSNRWYRYAQPPANSFAPSGVMVQVHVQ